MMLPLSHMTYSLSLHDALPICGMGEVYRAHDTKLNRDVALKVLPDAFASDPRRVARFKREAQTLAALNHSDRKSTRLNSSHLVISYAVFCLKKKKTIE